MEQNRYEKFIEALGQSERYVNVFRKYFCTASVNERQKDNNGKPVTIYVFSLGRAKDAQEFYKKWTSNRHRLEATISKRGGYRKPFIAFEDKTKPIKANYPWLPEFKPLPNTTVDVLTAKRNLAHGQSKYNDLHFFFTREPIFKELELMFPNQMGAVYCLDESSEPAKQYIINSLQKQLGVLPSEPNK